MESVVVAKRRKVTPGRVVSTLAHIALDPWIGLVCFIVVVVGTSLAIGLAVTVIGGVVALALTLLAAEQIGRFERARAAALLGITVRPPSVDAQSEEPPRFGTLGRTINSTAAWKALGYLVVQPVVGILVFSCTVIAWCLGPVLLSLPVTRFLFPSNRARLLITNVESTPGALVAAAFGVGVILAAPYFTILMGQVDAWLVRALLGANENETLRAEVVEASSRRSAAVDAAEAERRRIERDLHDGAQQRLVALGMTLGLAREKLDRDPQGARALLDEAHLEAKSAMTELRSIARGIHPAVLDDRGLDAALSAVAARCPIPVTLAVSVPRRLGQTIEGAAYYVVSEALTNIAKHADAHSARVEIDVKPTASNGGSELVSVIITDDGSGGAKFTPDGGLSGLRDRVSGVGGSFSLASPVGGPTVLTVEIPT
jgi:signal transduction histidine kinase